MVVASIDGLMHISLTLPTSKATEQPAKLHGHDGYNKSSVSVTEAGSDATEPYKTLEPSIRDLWEYLAEFKTATVYTIREWDVDACGGNGALRRLRWRLTNAALPKVKVGAEASQEFLSSRRCPPCGVMFSFWL